MPRPSMCGPMRAGSVGSGATSSRSFSVSGGGSSCALLRPSILPPAAPHWCTGPISVRAPPPQQPLSFNQRSTAATAGRRTCFQVSVFKSQSLSTFKTRKAVRLSEEGPRRSTLLLVQRDLRCCMQRMTDRVWSTHRGWPLQGHISCCPATPSKGPGSLSEACVRGDRGISPSASVKDPVSSGKGRLALT